MTDRQPSMLTRRSALRAGASGAAGAVGATALGLLQPSPGTSAPARLPAVGVLISSSDTFAPSLRRAMPGAAVVVKDVRKVGIHSGLEALIEADVDVVVAQMTRHAAAPVVQLGHEAGFRVITACVGAHVERDQDAETVTLGHWQNWFALGRWAARGHGRIFQIVAAPDAGYDTVFAARRAFTAAGGRHVGLAMTHQGDSIESAVRAARRSGADVVAVHATGGRAADILAKARRLDADLLVDSYARGVPTGALMAATAVGADRSRALAGDVAAHLRGESARRPITLRIQARSGRRVLRTLPAVPRLPAQMRVLSEDASSYINEYATI